MASLSEKILVVDDERPIADILKFNLEREGYRVITAGNGNEALQLVGQEQPDLVILDIMLPETDGFTVCRRIRRNSGVPIIMLTAKEEEVDKVLGLELGADDYVTKPFSPRELVARVKALFRRIHGVIDGNESPSRLVCEDLVVDLDSYEVRKGPRSIELTLREFELLKFLAVNAGQVFSRESLLERVWGYEFYGDIRTVDVTVRRLREKIEDQPSDPRLLLTRRGVGYFFRKF